MQELLIIGARGFGREVYKLATQCAGYNSQWKIKGFLDDKNDALDNYPNYPPIIGPVESYEVKKNDVFTCALGEVGPKEKYINIIKNKNGEFINLIHPNTIIQHNVIFGKGLIIGHFNLITCDVVIGDFVTIQQYCTFGHDVKVGNYCHFNAYSFLGGFVKIGNKSAVNVGAKILPKVVIGNNVTIGAGSIVIKKVPDDCTVFGNPGEIIFYK